MIIAIDESGSFGIETSNRSFFIAVHIRQRKTFYKIKKNQFDDWESKLPKSLKNSKGEIKSSSLSDEQLTDFARKIIASHFRVGITPFTVCPSDNPVAVIEKHRQVNLMGIHEGITGYTHQGKIDLSRTYEEFGHWLQNLSYSQYLKILVLGECITTSLVNTVGHSISGGYDQEELPRINFLIDRDFIKEPRIHTFWQEILRNQLYFNSRTNPLPLLKKWKTTNHPFLEKYYQDGRLNFNLLFQKHCKFVPSHDHWEIRLADAVNTIMQRYFNKKCCGEAFAVIEPHILEKQKTHQLIFKDFNLEEVEFKPEDNPWLKGPTV